MRPMAGTGGSSSAGYPINVLARSAAPGTSRTASGCSSGIRKASGTKPRQRTPGAVGGHGNPVNTLAAPSSGKLASHHEGEALALRRSKSHVIVGARGSVSPSRSRETRRTVHVRSVFRPSLALPLIFSLAAVLLGNLAFAEEKTIGAAGAHPQGASQSEIRLGMSADFSASTRGLSVELYRGAMAYLLQVNNTGGVNGRRVVIKAYDDRSD